MSLVCGQCIQLLMCVIMITCAVCVYFLVIGDTECDIDFDVNNQNQFIVWAIGGLDQTAFIHTERSPCK